jgi:predicted dinucleotide-binding enzyme
MNIGIFGTGVVARTLGERLQTAGHAVRLGTRDPAQTRARAEPDGYGNPPFAAWQAQHPDIRLGTYAEAAAHGELLVNATQGAGSLEALRAAGEGNLDGKILMDIANPLDSSRGMPPSLSVANTDSLGEQIQRAFPGVKVVKTLNTVNARVMAYPREVADGEHHVFLSGNEAEAKARVRQLLRDDFGWRHVIDLGDITTARGPEMYLPLWLRLWGALGNGRFNIKVVAGEAA